jgi:DNA-binding FadR family transcriptional regulator
MPAPLDDTSHGVLLKEQLASALEQVIVTGRPHARHRVAETIWPQEFSVAQASVQRDPHFHIALTSAPGNPCVGRDRSEILPANCVYSGPRPHERERPDTWIGHLPNHRLLLHMIREGNPILAGQRGQHCIRPFAASAYAVRENVDGSIEAHHNGQWSRGWKG